MKILIPTDFSKLSTVAVHYATRLAMKLDAEILLLNVVFINSPPHALAELKINQILDKMEDNAREDFELLMKEIKKETGNRLKVSYEIIKGFPVEDVVESFANHNDINLIIIGTKGASGLEKVLLGSNATAVISKSKIPVITVPEHGRFSSINHIVYASDMHSVNKEMATLIKFAQFFDASIHLLHIASPNSKKKFDKENLKDKLIGKHNYPKISIHIALNDEIEEAIDEYITRVKADLLAMFTHKPTFFEKLFGKSVTREMAFHSWIPLLSIKK